MNVLVFASVEIVLDLDYSVSVENLLPCASVRIVLDLDYTVTVARLHT